VRTSALTEKDFSTLPQEPLTKTWLSQGKVLGAGLAVTVFGQSIGIVAGGPANLLNGQGIQ
jgi:hypothetical protein